MKRKEEIEKASVDYQMSKHPMAIGGDEFADTIYKVNVNPSFIAGAEWADQHPKGLWDSEKFIEKACEYIYSHAHVTTFLDIRLEKGSITEFVDNFRKAMEE